MWFLKVWVIFYEMKFLIYKVVNYLWVKKNNDIDMMIINCCYGNICKGIFYKYNCIDNLFILFDGVVYLFLKKILFVKYN